MSISVVLYARVSTQDQNVKQQIEYLKKYSKKNGYVIKKVYFDTFTGSKLERPQFKNLLKYGNEGNVQNLLILDVNRLTRDFYNSMEIEKWIVKNSINLISAYEPVDLSTATGRMMFRIKMLVSAYERENTLEKIKIGVARAKAEGKYRGRKKGSRNKVIK